MPIYDYRCTDCGTSVELMRKFNDTTTESCPECGSHAFLKQVSAPNFQLNGKGWYATDFKHAGTAKPKETPTTQATPACASDCNSH